MSKTKVIPKGSTILPNAITAKTCKELYNAGMNIYQIAETLQLNLDLVIEYTECGENSYPPVKADNILINKILYDANVPIATEAVVMVEKDRFKAYAQIEQQSLSIMQNLLTYYSQVPPGDLKTDTYIKDLVTSLVKTTQSCREELLKKYAIDKTAENIESANKLTVEFIQTTQNDNDDDIDL